MSCGFVSSRIFAQRLTAAPAGKRIKVHRQLYSKLGVTEDEQPKETADEEKAICRDPSA